MDTVCLNCAHGPHTNRTCSNCKCSTWINATLQANRATVNISNILSSEIPRLESMLVDMLQLLVEQFPEAAARVDLKREENRKKMEEEKDKPEEGKSDAGETDK